MKKSTQWLVLISALLFLFACSKKEETNLVKISLHKGLGKSRKVKVILTCMLNHAGTTISESETDSLGNCFLQFNLDKSVFGTLKIGNVRNDIYLEPGYDLSLTYNSKTKEAIYSGVGSDINNYLNRITSIRVKIEQRPEGTMPPDLKPEQFLNRLDTIANAFNSFHQQFTDSVKLPKNQAIILKRRNKLRLLLMRQGYEWNYGSINDFQIPTKLEMSREIPYDSSLFESGMPEYALLLQFALNIKYARLLQGYEKSARIKKEKEIPLIINKEILGANYKGFVKEFLLAKNIDFAMARIGLDSGIVSLYTAFKTEHSAFPYLSQMESRYQRWLSIAPNHLAPEIKGINTNGDTLSTRDFVNKVIYIDVWATWCPPCVRQIPYSEKLEAKFKDEPVVFLNVSVDEDTASWKRGLAEYKTWGGQHILNDKSIYKTYCFNGIPRFILIDKKGKIVNSDALRPSSEQIEKEIWKLVR